MGELWAPGKGIMADIFEGRGLLIAFQILPPFSLFLSEEMLVRAQQQSLCLAGGLLMLVEGSCSFLAQEGMMALIPGYRTMESSAPRSSSTALWLSWELLWFKMHWL